MTPSLPTSDLPLIHILTAAGTMQRNPDDRLNYHRYVLSGEPRLTAREMLTAIPEIGRFAVTSVEHGDYVPSDSPAELVALARLVNERLSVPETDGVVLIHGTNTIEETAYFLNLTVRSRKPIIVTGSQRPFSTLSSDGPLNLLNAIRVAADPVSAGKGVLIVLNGEINASRDVTKSSTYGLAAFRSPDLGILGYADPDRVVFYRTPLRKHTWNSEFDVAKSIDLPKVVILYSHAGDDGDLAMAAVNGGAKGLIMAGTGAGSTHNARERLIELATRQGIAVVRCSRVGSGRIIRDDNWQGQRFVSADNLNPQKARILLQLCLSQGNDVEAIQRMFDEY